MALCHNYDFVWNLLLVVADGNGEVTSETEVVPN